MKTTTTTMASTCPFTTAVIVIITAAVIVVVVVIRPSSSVQLLRRPTSVQSTGDHEVNAGVDGDDDDDAVNMASAHLQRDDVMTTTTKMRTGDCWNPGGGVVRRMGQSSNASDCGRHDDDDDALNATALLGISEDLMKSLVKAYLQQTADDDDDDDDDDYAICYRVKNFVLTEKKFAVSNNDDDDDDDDGNEVDDYDDGVTLVKESTDVLTFKVVVQKYKSIRRRHPHPPPPPPHRHHQQHNGSHGDRQPIKFCLRRESNVNREKNSSDLYGRINYDNEEAGNETNGSDLLKMDSSNASDNRTPQKSTKTQAVVITTSSIVITIFFFTAVFLRIRNHIKRYRNSVRHKNNLRLHTSKCCQSDLSRSPNSRKFSKFLNILTNQNPSHFQETQLQPIQSEIRNLKLYYNETSRSDVDDFDDDAILPEVEEEVQNGDQIFKDNIRHHNLENKSVRFSLHDNRLPVLRSHSYNNDASVSTTTDEDGRSSLREDNNNKKKNSSSNNSNNGNNKKRRKFSFQGGNQKFDVRRMSRFQSNKSRRELLHRCLEQLNNPTVNE